MPTAEHVVKNAIENAVNGVQSKARAILTLGIILVILGTLSVIAPWATGLAVQAAVGLLLVAAGITWTVFAFHAKSWDSGLWEALVGVLSVASGVVMLAHPVVSLSILTLVVAVYFVSGGILKMVFAFQHKILPGRNWVIFDGVVSILLGVMITTQWPISGLWAIGTLVGVDLLFAGFGLIRIGSASEHILKAITGR
jgi:uncharacterized membrane protein HdeD (DUF308 family)